MRIPVHLSDGFFWGAVPAASRGVQVINLAMVVVVVLFLVLVLTPALVVAPDHR